MNRQTEYFLVLEPCDLVEDAKDKNIEDITLEDFRVGIKREIETTNFVAFCNETHKKVMKDRYDVVGTGFINKRKKATLSP